MTLIGDVFFWVLGVTAVLSGAAVFWVNSMARATYALAISFVAVGLQLLLLDQAYLGIITILMMVMEMAIMAVYMVMFMGMNPALMPMSMVHDKRLSLVIAIVTFALLATGILLTPWPSGSPTPTEDVTRALGMALMESKMLAMVVLSPVMVATIIAGVSLSRHRGRYDRYGDDLKRRKADDPQPGGVGR
ncbi:NADH-quinone oxidoreductase subunit J [Microbacterium esteraromaticum]|uniref:NADH-quinone oxidoreductase subunit J n=1 Tax=Microbacterium esteraromaticum TaxID=57043 RepID=UPI003094C4E2